LVPGQIPDEKIFQAIAPGFKQYPSDRFEFINASAESLNVETKKVTITGPTGQQALSYDILILATGSNTKEDAPFKGNGTTEATKDALHVFQNKVKQAQNIYIAGAGATGVETAGEIAFEHGKQKKITLVRELQQPYSLSFIANPNTQIASGAHVLEGTPASVTKVATKQLSNLNVTIKTSTKVMGSAKMPDGRTELTLSGGEKVIADLYIPTMGVIPNSAYVPGTFVNNSGFVKVDEFLRVKGATDVWALGDVSQIFGIYLATYMHFEVEILESVWHTLKTFPSIPKCRILTSRSGIGYTTPSVREYGEAVYPRCQEYCSNTEGGPAIEVQG
jgi:NADH dehydrogenase FAD-containing subunit